MGVFGIFAKAAKSATGAIKGVGSKAVSVVKSQGKALATEAKEQATKAAQETKEQAAKAVQEAAKEAEMILNGQGTHDTNTSDGYTSGSGNINGGADYVNTVNNIRSGSMIYVIIAIIILIAIYIIYQYVPVKEWYNNITNKV